MSKTIRNKYDALCHLCGQIVAAGTGLAIGTPNGQRRRTAQGWTYNYTWRTQHTPRTWSGSPISGQWVGGCPENTSELNAALLATRTEIAPQ